MISRRKSSSLVFIILIVIFILPVIFSWIIYLFHNEFHLRTSNRGILLPKPIQINSLLKKKKVKQWSIIVASDLCEDNQVEKIIFNLHQLHIILGENRDRVNLQLWTDKKCIYNQVYDFRKIILDSEEINKLEVAMNHAFYNKIYLADPIGNLFMYYPLDTDLMNIYHDINHVLRASQIG